MFSDDIEIILRMPYHIATEHGVLGIDRGVKFLVYIKEEGGEVWSKCPLDDREQVIMLTPPYFFKILQSIFLFFDALQQSMFLFWPVVLHFQSQNTYK